MNILIFIAYNNYIYIYFLILQFIRIYYTIINTKNCFDFVFFFFFLYFKNIKLIYFNFVINSLKMNKNWVIYYIIFMLYYYQYILVYYIIYNIICIVNFFLTIFFFGR